MGEGVEQVVGNGTVRLNYHYKMIQCQISVLHILVFQGRSVLCVVLFTWLNLGCNNYFLKIYTELNFELAVLTGNHIALIPRQFKALGEPRPAKSICSLVMTPF